MATSSKSTVSRRAKPAKRRARAFDRAGVEAQLRLRAQNIDLVLRKLEEAKVVKQETMQFEFSV